MSFNLIPVFGAAVFGSGQGNWGDEKGAASALEALTKNGVTHVDTAQMYADGQSEAALGNLEATKKFTVDTKWISGWKGEAWASAKTIEETAKVSLQKLKTNQVDIFYLHSPDLHTPFAETLKGVQEVYKSGGFKRFGLSNFTAAQTREVFEICEKNDYVRPTVYQLSYSAVARKSEDELIPLLRKNGVSIYAYSPIAGGFLTKTREFIEGKQGRFSTDVAFGIYYKMYKSEAFMNLLGKWDDIAKSEGVSKAELAYRWVNHHSALKKELGDGLVFGGSSLEQIEQTTAYLKAGPLSEKAAAEIDALWATVKDDAIMDNFQAVFG